MHEWPLSSVQRITFQSGQRVAYKAQLPPTVEPEFYQRAQSSLLPDYRIIGEVENCTTMAIGWIEHPSLQSCNLDVDMLVSHGRQVLSHISRLDEDLPVHLNVGTSSKWISAVEKVAKWAELLNADGRFPTARFWRLSAVYHWARSSAVMNSIDRSRLIHGDLKAEQIFIVDGGYKVIDWQRPMFVPSEIDLVSILVTERQDPRFYVDVTTVRLFWFLRLYWAMEAQADLFPDYRGDLFERWTAQSIKRILE